MCEASQQYLRYESKSTSLAQNGNKTVYQYISVSYLLDTERPALTDAVSRPDVVCVLGELVHHGFLGRGQFDVTQV